MKRSCLIITSLIALYTQLSFATAPAIPTSINKNLIDIHTHIACISAKNGCYLSEAFKKHWKFGIYLKALDVTKEELEEKGDEIVAQKLSELVQDSKFIDKAVVLGLDGFYDDDGKLNFEKTQIMVANSFVLAQTKKFSNLLYAPSIHPLRKDALEALEQAKKDGAILVKWIPCIMNITPDSPDARMTAFYKKLVELDLPLLSHTGDEHSFLSSEDKLCAPKRLKLPLDLGVKVIAAHLGTNGKQDGEKNLEQMKRLLKDYPQLKFDISSLVNINKWNHIKYALDYPGRFYYGTDYPLIRAKLLGIPMASKAYYIFKLNSEWRKYIGQFTNEFDRDVALKLALGVSMEDLEKSKELLPAK